VVPVRGSTPGQDPKRHKPGQIHEISIMRVISSCQTNFRLSSVECRPKLPLRGCCPRGEAARVRSAARHPARHPARSRLATVRITARSAAGASGSTSRRRDLTAPSANQRIKARSAAMRALRLPSGPEDLGNFASRGKKTRTRRAKFPPDAKFPRYGAVGAGAGSA
jgi:hypothetical protein